MAARDDAGLKFLALQHRLFRLFTRSDIHEGHDAQGPMSLHHQMRPILYGKTTAIPSPENLVVSMDTCAFLKTQVNRTLLERIRRTVRPSVVLGLVHVFPHQFGSIAVSKYPSSGVIAEHAGACGVAAKDGLSSGSKYHVDSLFAFAQRKFRRFVGGDIVRRDKMSRAACPIDAVAADFYFDQSSIPAPASADLRMIKKCWTFYPVFRKTCEILWSLDVYKLHGQEFIPGIAIVMDGGLVSGKKV